MRPAAAGSSNVESFTVCTIVNQRLLKAAPPQHDFRLLPQCGHQVARKPREQPLKSSQAKPPCFGFPLVNTPINRFVCPLDRLLQLFYSHQRRCMAPRRPSLSAFSWSADRDHRVLMIAGTDALSPASS
jgi:hypothetical protein